MFNINAQGHAYSEFASGGYVATPSDSENLPKPSTGGLLIKGGGSGKDLKVDFIDGTTVTIPDVPNGHLKVLVTKIYSTGTTGGVEILVFT